MRPKLFQEFFQIPSKEFGPTSNDDPDSFPIAKDDKLTGILDHAVSAPPDFAFKCGASKYAFHIPHLPSDHATVYGSFCTEKLAQPLVGRDAGGNRAHGVIF